MTTKKGKRAFTLAETLITLLVIGVVAALTIPVLMQQIGEKTLEKQKETTAPKLAEGFANMRVAGDLETKYASTAEFVEAMKKHFQITQVCNSSNLSACFVETVITNDGEEPVSNNINEMQDVDKVVGIRFADGVSMLIKYNTEAEGIAEGDVTAGRMENRTSLPTYNGLFEYIFDVNNVKTPNTKGKDIVGNLSVAKGSNPDPYELGFEIINNTVYTSSAFGYAQGPEYSNDYWLGAKNYCESLGGSLPDKSQLQAIAAKLYPCTPEGGEYWCDANTSHDLWALVGNTDLWSSVPIDDYGTYYRYFDEDGSNSNDYDRNNGDVRAVCVR